MKSITKLKNFSKCIFYFHTINDIGGVESVLWYLSQLYDIEVYYKEGNIKQLERLSKQVPVHKYTGGRIQCNKAFWNYNPDIIDFVDAKEHIGVIHCDYKQMPFSPCLHPKITKWIGVSQLVCDSFEEITGIKAEPIYNPVVIDRKVEKPLIIVCATRLTFEKGKDNIISLGRKLTEKGKPYLIIVFTNDKDKKHEINNPNIVYADPQLDIAPYLKMADWVFVPSKTEAFGLTAVESACLGIPTLLMDLPVWNEIGFRNSENCLIVKDIDKFDLDKLWNTKLKFTYEPPKSNWNKYLPKKTKAYDPNRLVKVKAKADYYDTQLKEQIIYGKEFDVSISRAIYLEELKLVNIL